MTNGCFSLFTQMNGPWHRLTDVEREHQWSIRCSSRMRITTWMDITLPTRHLQIVSGKECIGIVPVRLNSLWSHVLALEPIIILPSSPRASLPGPGYKDSSPPLSPSPRDELPVLGMIQRSEVYCHLFSVTECIRRPGDIGQNIDSVASSRPQK